MSELEPVYSTKLKHTGIFVYPELYNFVFEWLRTLEYTVIEQRYNEKIRPDGKEVEILWLCLRKINDYFRYRIKVSWLIKQMVDVEVTEDGIKKKKNKAKITIKISSFLEKDYENKWEQNPIAKFLRGVYDKFVINTKIEAYQDRLAEEVEETLEQGKAFLALEGRREP